jgi:hypothetical protein
VSSKAELPVAPHKCILKVKRAASIGTKGVCSNNNLFSVPRVLSGGREVCFPFLGSIRVTFNGFHVTAMRTLYLQQAILHISSLRDINISEAYQFLCGNGRGLSDLGGHKSGCACMNWLNRTQ